LLALIFPILAARAERRTTPRNVAILVFDGVQVIDFTAPLEVFGHVPLPGTDDRLAYNTYTVAKTAAPVTTWGMRVAPAFDFATAPRPDVLVIPGGDVRAVENDPQVLKWVRDAAGSAEIVLSVCNGAFILAKAGLLDDRRATTFAPLIPSLQEAAPKTRVVDDVRYVDNGKIITTAGLSSGIDGALHVIERLDGKGWAQNAALVLEYDWDPGGRYVRAALADRYLWFPLDFDGDPIEKTGDRDRWRSIWLVRTAMDRPQFLEHVDAILQTNHPRTLRNVHWTRVGGDRSNESRWRFVDAKGRPWKGTARVEEATGQPGQLKLTLSVAKER